MSYSVRSNVYTGIYGLLPDATLKINRTKIFVHSVNSFYCKYPFYMLLHNKIWFLDKICGCSAGSGATSASLAGSCQFSSTWTRKTTVEPEGFYVLLARRCQGSAAAHDRGVHSSFHSTASPSSLPIFILKHKLKDERLLLLCLYSNARSRNCRGFGRV